ncbi:MAG: Obg family GTPase CgtA [Bdellovibrionaceae bacterium]|nr:Obg family GTPase CgtA [Pseudobdellovibrionaceae bacterium]
MFNYKDQFVLNVASGDGGDGAVSFYRTKKNPRGGPDGGDGAKGGSIIFTSSNELSGFEHFKNIKKYKAGSGGKGAKQLKSGKTGKNIIIKLPLGTLVRNSQGEILKDFAVEKEELFLEGGTGGRGNAFFKSSLNQAPRKFQKGKKGKSQKIILELKPLVDVAIIGKVNTGKSSFFNLVTKAQSKVAVYPYTTLVPHIGQLKSMSHQYFLMDIPGLEKGASKNIFKGLSFLRSIQRSKILLHFIDALSNTPLEDLLEIYEELKAFDKKYSEFYFQKLQKKTCFYVLTKIDELSSKKNLDDILQKIKIKKNQKIFTLSNKTKKGLKKLLSHVENLCVS